MSTGKSPATPAATDLAFTAARPYGSVAEPTYSGALSFLRRPYTKDLAGADVAVVGVPFDLATTNRPGARLGPRAIRAASASLAWCPPYAWGFDPLERLNVIDWGDVFFDPGRPQEAPDAIHAALAAGPLIAMLLIARPAARLLAPGTDLQAAAVLFIGSVQGLVMQSLLSGQVGAIRTLAPAVFDLFQHAVAAPTNPTRRPPETTE
mgnify:CR=1 FL=1